MVSVSRDAASQPAGDGLQQRVADGVPERIVDLFEAVEIQAQHGHRPLVAGAGERLLQTLGQQYAIGQIGQRIMVRHVGDFRFVAMPFGQVADGVDLIAAQARAERLANDLDGDELAKGGLQRGLDGSANRLSARKRSPPAVRRQSACR